MVRMTGSKTVVLKLHAPQAKKVNLAGTFNNWNTKALSARKDSKGNWVKQLNLKPGKYEYKFFVDGSWVNDPHCNSCVSNSFGTQNCILEIK